MVDTSEVCVKGILSWCHKSGPWTYGLKGNFFRYAGNTLLFHAASVILFSSAPCYTLSFCSDFCGFVCISIKFFLKESESRDAPCRVTVQKIITLFWAEKKNSQWKSENTPVRLCSLGFCYSETFKMFVIDNKNKQNRENILSIDFLRHLPEKTRYKAWWSGSETWTFCTRVCCLCINCRRIKTLVYRT